MIRHFGTYVLCLAGLGSVGYLGQLPDYRPVAAWPQLPDGFRFGGITAVAVDDSDNVYVFHRGKQKPIALFDKTGNFLRGWGDGDIKTAHGLRLDPDGNVWTTDLGTHQVIKWNTQGVKLLTLGTRNKPGTTRSTFNKPADIAFTPKGDVYVADGYGNSRVVKFSREGKYLLEWGKRGTKPGEFHLPHAIFRSAAGKIYVGDRENNRVQAFDDQGKFLEQWPQTGAPYGLFLQQQKNVLLADGRANVIRLLDLQGKELRHWGKKGTAPGQFQLAHGIAADSQGHLYVTEVGGKRIQKFTP